MASVRRISPADWVEGDPTPGMVRKQAVTAEGVWAGLVETAPHMVSG